MKFPIAQLPGSGAGSMSSLPAEVHKPKPPETLAEEIFVDGRLFATKSRTGNIVTYQFHDRTPAEVGKAKERGKYSYFTTLPLCAFGFAPMPLVFGTLIGEIEAPKRLESSEAP